MATDALITDVDHYKWFDVNTEKLDYQRGACTVQEHRPAAYFSHKLSNLKQSYTVMEKDFLHCCYS